MANQRIGRYEVKRELGRGGMATVYLAFDPSFGREVAIKVLPREFLHDPMFRGRFEREARMVAHLEHPAIVPVYDFGEENGQPYLVMRHMAGGTLANRMGKGPLPLVEISRIMERVGAALDYAHGKGVVHRDLKPGNILFDAHGHAFIADFGIAKLVEATATFTGSAIIGTPAYMSPEQAMGTEDLDGRSDVYALGVILFQLLTGRQPYESNTPMGMALKHVHDPVPDPLVWQPALPVGAQMVVARAMAKKREERFATAGELATSVMAITAGRPLPLSQPADLAALGPTEVIAPAPPTRALGSPLPVSPAQRRLPAWGWAVGGCLLLALCGLVISSAGGLAALGLRNRTNGTVTPAGIADQPENTPRATPADTASPSPPPTATATATPDTAATATAKAMIEATAQMRSTATAQAQRTATAEARATATAAGRATATAEVALTAAAAAEATAEFLAAVAATPQAIMLAAKNNEPMHGPVSGSLAHDPADGFIETVLAEVDLHDFVAQARFYNPYPAGETEWDFGFLFLWTTEAHVRLIVASDGSWELTSFEETSEDLIGLDGGEVSNLDVSGNGSNQLTLVVVGETGYFLVNNVFIASLDLSAYSQTGEVAAGTGFYEGSEADGEETPYEDFTVWAVGEAPVVVSDPTNTPGGSSIGSLLQAMRSAKSDMERLGGLIDGAVNSGFIDCQDAVNTFDRVANAPTFNVAGSGSSVQNAYNNYRAAISTFTNGARDMAQNCRDFLASGGAGSIPFQQWGLARQRINDALAILNPAIESID